MSELPRPPRRVPPGADDGTPLRPRTVIESGRAGAVRPPRPWYLLPVVIAVLAAGAGVGWLVRVQNGDDPLIGGFDPDDVLKSAGPAVVRVHASTCATEGMTGGTGLATGVFIDSNRVLTLASAVRAPVAIAVETADGRVRSAQVDGVDRADPNNGLAVLRVFGDPLGITPPQLADTTPADGQDVPVIGYDDSGKQEVDLHAITRSADGGQLTGTSGLLQAGYAGAPVFDRAGRMIGMVTKTGSSGAAGVGTGVLRDFETNSRDTSVTRTPNGCNESKGPQTPVVPGMNGPTGALAQEARTVLGEYLTAINRHDVPAVQELFEGTRLEDKSADELRKQYQWESIFSPVIRNVSADGDGAEVQMTHTSLQKQGAEENELRCRRYDLTYGLIRVDGRLHIGVVTQTDRGSRVKYLPCTTG